MPAPEKPNRRSKTAKADLFEESPFPDYLSPIAEELKDTYKYVSEIGSGKTGKTYKIESRSGNHSFCLKTISPDVVDTKERERVRQTLSKEVAILEPLNHRCLPLIYEHNLELQLPYYVSSYHPGATLERFRQGGTVLKLEEAVFVIVSLMDALEYIHDFGRTHCDLHENNILLSHKVFAEGLMIIDFGSGHRDSASQLQTPDRGHLGFKNIRGQSQHKRVVQRVLAADDFRARDIRAFGRALALMEKCFFSSASHDQLMSYREFSRILQDGVLDNWTQVREQFDHVIDPNAFMTKAEKFFVMKDGSRAAITIPVSDAIPVGEAVLAIVNCQAFQRLRNIKQLSFCEWFFPGATHTRFEHSLGVFGVTRKALSFLARDPNFKSRFSQANIDGTLLAALVHDIGHYPYAHVVEHYVAGRYPFDKDVRRSIHHFENTLDILQKDEQLQKAILTHWGENAAYEAERILRGSIPPLSEILDGAVDCDKLDYLQRDAHHCGVRYGSGIDMDGVLSSFRCSHAGEHILIDASRVHAVEGFMVAQDQMLAAVYWHGTIRSVFAMFHRFLDGALGNDPAKLVEFVDGLKACSSEFDAFHKIVLPLLEAQPKAQTSKRHGSRGELEPLVRLHQIPNFNDIYQPIARYSTQDPIDPKRIAANNLFESILKLPSNSDATTMPIQWDRVRRLRNCFREALKEKGVQPGRFDVLVDVPWGKASNRVVAVLDEDGRTERPITLVSHLADTIFTNPTAYSAPVRVYVAPKWFSRFENSLGSIRRSAEERYFGNGNFEDD